MADFRLIDHEGYSHQLKRILDRKAILLVAVGHDSAPLREHFPAIKAVMEPLGGDIETLLVGGGQGCDRDSLAALAGALESPFPILHDETGLVLQQLGFAHSGDLALIDTATWQIRFRSTLGAAATATEAFRGALSTGGPFTGSNEATAAEPLVLELPGATPDYATVVAPVLAAKCYGCHSPGGTGPFAMTSHKKVTGWAAMIREMVMTAQMPPWSADPHFGFFSNGQALDTAGKTALVTWIDAGAPRGAGADPLEALAPPAQEPWQLGAPDMILSLSKPEIIPAEGILDYRFITVEIPIAEDRWLRAAQVRPGNPAVVHHALTFIQWPKERRWMQYMADGGDRAFTAGYVPGSSLLEFPEGSGQYVPKGSRMIFQMHYTVTGKEETDRTEMGLYFTEGRPQFEYNNRSAFHRNFVIHPNDGNHALSAKFMFKEDGNLFAMSPHMHFRGSRMKYIAHYPDGQTETLLSVVDYNFNWQHTYKLAEPKFIPKGTIIECEGAFDNSVRNARNPDPEQTVRRGQQSFNEMYIGYIHYAGATPIPEGDYRRR
ncbi:MAG: hypothetical protein HYV27_00080 [Candidatus Hydrogenedentes bacterium]|nr:hypothetical protein [Candidatus Hydrogenedentota bacterium]